MATSFVGHSGPAVTITDAFSMDTSSATAIFVVPGHLDFSVITDSEVGVQIFAGGVWVDSLVVVYDPEAPSLFYAAFDSPGDLTGLPWRLVSPVTGWTSDNGKALYPSSGTLGAPEELPAAKIAVEKLLTDRLERR